MRDAGVPRAIGRQGDGYRFHAAADKADLQLLFRPTRFNGDRALPVVLKVPRTGAAPESVQERECFSISFHPAVLGLTIRKADEPAVLYQVVSPDGQPRLCLAILDGKHWLHRTIFGRAPLRQVFSDLKVNSSGEVTFAAVSLVDGDVWYVTVTDHDVNVQRVWQDVERAAGNSVLPVECALHYAPDGSPVVLVARNEPDAGYIRTFRPDF